MHGAHRQRWEGFVRDYTICAQSNTGLEEKKSKEKNRERVGALVWVWHERKKKREKNALMS